MTTKKLKIIIIALVIITFIIIGITWLLMTSDKSKEETELQLSQDIYANMFSSPASIANGQKPQIIQNENMYFNVKKAMETYLQYNTEKNAEAVYNLLDAEYIQNNAINQDNVLTKVNIYNSVDGYTISEAYEIDGIDYIKYYAKGTLNNQELLYNVNIDYINETFSIAPMGQEEFTTTLDTTVEGQSGAEKQITDKGYNKLELSSLQESEIARAYLKDYLDCMKNNPEKAYNLLDSEYRETRFPTLESYKQYINANKDKINTTVITAYQVEDNQTKYICKDNYENYYTFNKMSAMKYTVIPDNYTLQTEAYNEEYNKLSDEQKVKTNLEKYVKMLSDKNYTMAYNQLNEEFRNQYFKTQKNFETYIKANFFDNNILGISSITKQGEVYVCETNIKESLSTAARDINKTFVVLLTENNNFEISFTV